MTYQAAIEILGLTTPKSFARNAKLAQTIANSFGSKTPLKMKVAAKVVIQAA